jgi:lysophospholipase L1-like esterase
MEDVGWEGGRRSSSHSTAPSSTTPHLARGARFRRSRKRHRLDRYVTVPDMRYRLLLVLVALALPLLFAEGFLRIRGSASHTLIAETARLARLMEMHEEARYLTFPPGRSLRGWGHDIRLNQLGMRDPEPVIPKPEQTRRILVLGDSFAFGQGVAQEEALPFLLRASLAKDGVGVVNGATPGWNTLEQERFFNHNVARLDPDLVLILYVINDREPDNPFRRARIEAVDFGARLHRSLLATSRLYEYVTFTYRKTWAGPDDSMRDELIRWAAYQGRRLPGEPFDDADPGWQKSRNSLRRIHQAMRARGGEMFVVFLRSAPAKSADSAYAALVELGREAGIEVMDAWPYYEGHAPSKIVIDPLVDPHPNALGHELLAAGIETSLREQGWLSSPGRRASPIR